MRILAIDPGYERLGIAVLEKVPRQKEVLLYSACVQTAKELLHAKRLLKIADEVRKVIDKFKPDAAAIETLFFTTNQKTVMPVAEARGVVLVEAARAGLMVYEYTPLQIKIAVTGYGRSDKAQVMSMVKKLIAVPEEKSLSLEDSRTPCLASRQAFTKRRIRLDDEYDAIAVGLTCLESEKLNNLSLNN